MRCSCCNKIIRNTSIGRLPDGSLDDFCSLCKALSYEEYSIENKDYEHGALTEAQIFDFVDEPEDESSDY